MAILAINRTRATGGSSVLKRHEIPATDASSAAAAARNGRNEVSMSAHHTDCGTSRLSGREHAGLLAAHFGVDPTLVDDRAVRDPRAAVAFDVELLRTHPFIPDSLVISGVVYDIDAGRVDLVVPPA